MSDFVQLSGAHLLVAAAQNVGESDFVSPFWSWYIIAIVVFGFVFCLGVLITQLLAKTNKAGEEHLKPHVWDVDLQEYNHPLPRWWVGMFFLCIAAAATYLFFYPGFGSYKGRMDLIDPAYKGGWTEQKQYEKNKMAVDAASQPLYDKFAKMSVAQLAEDKDAMKVGQRLFLNNCAQCHGDGALGGNGFPNLTDGDWLYGGFPDAIRQTITTGRHGLMPSQAEGLKTPAAITDVANYVLSLSASAHDPVAAARGKEKFVACAACHQATGKGSITDETGAQATTGAPNLTDKTWLYGGDLKTITETISKGRNKNKMPSWDCFLGQGRINVLTAYVWQLNRGDDGKVKNPEVTPAYLSKVMADNEAKITQARADAQSKGLSQCQAVDGLFNAK